MEKTKAEQVAPVRAEQRQARRDTGIGYQDRDIFEAFLKLPVPQHRLIREVILTFARVYADARALEG